LKHKKYKDLEVHWLSYLGVSVMHSVKSVSNGELSIILSFCIVSHVGTNAEILTLTERTLILYMYYRAEVMIKSK
jgi:hypothetical protein